MANRLTWTQKSLATGALTFGSLAGVSSCGESSGPVSGDVCTTELARAEAKRKVDEALGALQGSPPERVAEAFDALLASPVRSVLTKILTQDYGHDLSSHYTADIGAVLDALAKQPEDVKEAVKEHINEAVAQFHSTDPGHSRTGMSGPLHAECI